MLLPSSRFFQFLPAPSFITFFFTHSLLPLTFAKLTSSVFLLILQLNLSLSLIHRPVSIFWSFLFLLTLSFLNLLLFSKLPPRGFLLVSHVLSFLRFPQTGFFFYPKLFLQSLHTSHPIHHYVYEIVMISPELDRHTPFPKIFNFFFNLFFSSSLWKLTLFLQAKWFPNYILLFMLRPRYW